MHKKNLVSYFLVISLLFCLMSCSSKVSHTDSSTTHLTAAKDALLSTSEATLSEGRDMGQEYIDSFVFLGESTTYHLKNRGVLSGGTNTLQVWGPKSGTLMLDSSTASCRIVYPETGEEIDISTAMEEKKPEFLLLTFGLNGATANISKGSDYYKTCYKKLISTLRSASPDTVIILQSCFPVASNMDMSGYSVSVSTLNRYIDIINSWTAELAASLSLGYLNTSEILKDENGFLRTEYQVGDGYHLTKDAYVEILKYIRTHGYKENNNE